LPSELFYTLKILAEKNLAEVKGHAWFKALGLIFSFAKKKKKENLKDT
jgi:hypothetical protein